MSLSNFHTHCFFCDGEGEPEQYIEKAIELGFTALGFSSHTPIPVYDYPIMKQSEVPEYCNTINKLKEKYKGRIEIYLGLEVDYVPGVIGPRTQWIQSLGLDYTIGSVHMIYDGKSGEYLAVDGPPEDYNRLYSVTFNGNIERFINQYYSQIREMVKLHSPDIIGHFDLVRKNNINNSYFSGDEPWYRSEIMDTLQVISKSDCIVEINTGAISRGYLTTPYPSALILRECRKLDIPIIVNSDAHFPEAINTYFKESVDLLKSIGYTTQRILKDGKWTDVEL